MVFSKDPKVVVFFFLVFFQNYMVCFSFSWPKPQGCHLVFHGFFQSSQSHFFLPSHTLEVMVFFFLDFSKAPKAPKAVFFLFLVFFQNSMVMVFFFLAKTSKLWSSFSWFFPKFLKSSSFS